LSSASHWPQLQTGSTPAGRTGQASLFPAWPSHSHPGTFQIGQEIHNLPNVGLQVRVLAHLQPVKHGENNLLIGLDDVTHWNVWRGVDGMDERSEQAVGVEQTLQLVLVMQILPHCTKRMIVAASFLKHKII